MKKRKKYGFNYTIVENVSMTQNKQIWIVKKKVVNTYNTCNSRSTKTSTHHKKGQIAQKKSGQSLCIGQFTEQEMKKAKKHTNRCSTLQAVRET